MEKSGAKAYLVNTGWNGTGKRISIKDTRGIIDAILNGDIKNAPTKTIPYFNFEVPTELPGVDPAILDPRDTYADASEWETKAKDLADRFIKNFAKYEGNAAGKALVSAGPSEIRIRLPKSNFSKLIQRTPQNCGVLFMPKCLRMAVQMEHIAPIALRRGICREQIHFTFIIPENKTIINTKQSPSHVFDAAASYAC